MAATLENVKEDGTKPDYFGWIFNKERLHKSHRCAECLCFLMEERETNPKSDEVRVLKSCGSCRIVYYCGKECQKKNWKAHKYCCNYVKNLRLEIETLEKNFEVTNSRPIKPKEIEFHKKCDGICESYYPEIIPKDPYLYYVWKKQCFAYAIWNFAEGSKSYPIYDQIFKLIVEIMRMSAFGLCEMRKFLVMALFNMDRDDEAYNVITFWMTKFEETNSKTMAKMMNDLQIGEWLYLPDQDRSELILSLIHI